MIQSIDTLSSASLPQRSCAKILDFVVIFIIALAGDPIVVHSGDLRPFIEPLGLPLMLGYLLFCDALSNGQSIGKRLLKIKVINNKTGKNISIFQSGLRNLIFYIIWYLEIGVVAFGEDQRRLGDRAAATRVVRLHPLPPPLPTPQLRPVNIAAARETIQKIHKKDA